MEKIHWDFQPTSNDELVILNIGGVRFETYLSTLERFPVTRLCSVAEHLRKRNRRDNVEVYFDRNAACFSAILDYMRTGELHQPLTVCGAQFRTELHYWGIQDRIMQKCCVSDYIRAIDAGSKLRYFTSYIAGMADSVAAVNREGSRIGYWRKVAWKTMMMPTYSRPALIYSIVAYILLIVNVGGILAQSVIQTHLSNEEHRSHTVNRTKTAITFESCQTLVDNLFISSKKAHALVIMDIVCSIIFTLEIVARFLVAPSWREILRCVSNHIELISLIPFYFLMFNIVHYRYTGICPFWSMRVVRVLFILRVIRIFRLFFLLRYYSTFRVFLFTIFSSCRELLMLFTLVTMTTIVMGSLVSLIESAYLSNDESSKFEDLSSGLWWALVTITTVGYGDVVPASPPGRVMTVLVALSGIVVIALATPMVSGNFNLVYTYLLGNDILTDSDNQADEHKLKKTSPDKHVEDIGEKSRMLDVRISTEEKISPIEEELNNKSQA